MKKRILMYSQNTHSYLKNELKFAANHFQKVVLLAPIDEELESVIQELENVHYISYQKKDLMKLLIINIYKIFKKEQVSELKYAFKNKLYSKDYIMEFLRFLSIEIMLENVVEKKLNLSKENSKEWVFYSAWYYYTANAIVNVGQKFEGIKKVSLAHSFEVDSIKNNYVDNFYRKKYHDGLDLISFISKNVYDMYAENIAIPLNLSLDKTEVRYLGTKKSSDTINPLVESNIIRVVSCSNVIPVKRVDLIFDALNEMNDSVIEWTHIGEGDHLPKLKEKVKKQKNPNLKINLTGKMKNEDIHELYSNQPFDVFINVSSSEGIPVTLMEAIAYGIPVMATDVGGNNELVRDEFGKLLSSDPSIIEIKKSLLKLKKVSKEENKKMRQHAVEFYEKKFNSDKIRTDFFEKLKSNASVN